MKLLFVADYFPLSDSGVFRVYDFVRFLESFGVSVSVVSRMNLSDVLKVKAQENIGSVKVYRAVSLDLRLGVVVFDLFQTISTFLLCSVAVLLSDVDFIIASVPPGVPGIGAFFAAKILRRKVVFDVRDKWEEYSINHSKYGLVRCTHALYKRLFDVLYKKSNLVISVTPSLVTYLKARGSAKVVFIPNGADVRLFHPRDLKEKWAIRSELGLNKGDVTLVYAGSIGAYYATDFVIRAIRYLLERNYISHVKFVMMGMGESSKIRETLKLIKNLGLENNAIFLGKQKREDVARILSCCDLGIVPYDDSALWLSAYSTKFFEYCSAGLPVIATVMKDSDLATLIRKHKVGYIVDPLNVAQFASAVREFCNLSGKEKKEMNNRARDLIVNFFDRRKTTRKLVEALRGV